jgi:hypothetical protein
MLCAASRPDACQTRAQLFIGRRTRKERLSQRTQVKARAAHEDRETTASLNLNEFRQRRFSPSARREVDVRRNEVEQMMRHAASLCQRHFRRRDLDLLIDLYGVAVDDLAIEAQRQFDAEFAFTGSCWSRDSDNRRLCSGEIHEAENKRRKMSTAQMTASSASAPTICAREKRMMNRKLLIDGKTFTAETRSQAAEEAQRIRCFLCVNPAFRLCVSAVNAFS